MKASFTINRTIKAPVVGGATELTYTVNFTAKVPRTEPVLGPIQRQAIGQLVSGIAKSVE